MADDTDNTDPTLLREACAAHAEDQFYKGKYEKDSFGPNYMRYLGLAIKARAHAYTAMLEADPSLKAEDKAIEKEGNEVATKYQGNLPEELSAMTRNGERIGNLMNRVEQLLKIKCNSPTS